MLIKITRKFTLNITCIILLLFLSSLRLNAQFEYYSLEEGLSQATVKCILQDRTGFLWLGTQEGVNRFDGYQFTKFGRELRDANSLPGNYISCISEDKNGIILIGTINGAALYDPLHNKFSKISINNENNKLVELGSVSSFIRAKDGSLWIGTYYSGVYWIVDNKVTHFTKNQADSNSLSDNYITSICEDNRGYIWIGTYSQGINKLNVSAGKFEKIKLVNKNSSKTNLNYITTLAANTNGNVLVGTTNGLGILDVETNEVFTYRNSESKNNILSIYCESEKSIWLAVDGEGVFNFNSDSKSFTKIRVEARKNPAEEEKNIISIYQDQNGNFWFGTSTNGVIKWKKNKYTFNSYSIKNTNNTLSNYSIRSVFIDKENNTWIGTDFGLNKIVGSTKRIIKYFSSSSNVTTINDNKVWAITEDRNGNLWFGTQCGLALYKKKSNQFKRIIIDIGTNESAPVFPIRSIYVDNENKLWFGTFGAGLFSYDIKTGVFESHTLANKNPDARKDVVVFQIKEDKQNRLWLSAASGLGVYNKLTREYKRYFSDSKDGFTNSPSVLYSIDIENDSTIWLGTLGDGLIKFNPLREKFSIYSDKLGLPNNTIYGILRDRKNNLWLSTNLGVSKFCASTAKIKNYDKNDGIPTDEFNTGAFTADRSGNLYFGGIDGLLFFHPDSISANVSKPKLAVTNFKVFDKPINTGKAYFDNEGIRLNYKQNFFSFEFASLDLTSPLKNEYAYMLEGYDNGWVMAGKRRYAAYTNVEPGEYRLRLKATNSDRLWNERGISIFLAIEPPFWATIWFRFIIVSLASGIVLLFYFRRIKRFKNETEKQIIFSRQLIAAQEGERKRLAAELHDGVGQNLLIVSNLTQLALKKPDSAERNLNVISETIKESIADIRQISKELHPYHIEELGVTIALQSLINRIKKSTEEVVFHDIIENVDQYFNLDESINLFRIVQESVNNIIKHSKAKTVVISLCFEEGIIQLVIKDDGIGISDLNIPKLQSGLGLRTMKERTIALKGKLAIESSEKSGTTIKIQIPK